MLSIQCLKQTSFLSLVSSSKAVLNQWNPVSRVSTHAQAGLQCPCYFWGCLKRFSFISLFSSFGPTVIWRCPLSIQFLKMPRRLPLERDHQFPRRARQTHWYRLLPYFILMCCSPFLLWTLLLSHLLCLVPVYHPLSDSTLAAHSLASKCHLPARTDYISVKSVGWLTWINWKTEVTFYQLVIARV